MEVPIGHRLINHPGKCNNYHGHNYEFTFVLNGEVCPETGMLVDYSELKAAARGMLERFDHAMVLQLGDVLIATLRDLGSKYVVFHVPPTAENFAEYFRNVLAEAFPLFVCTVMVKETKDTDATA